MDYQIIASLGGDKKWLLFSGYPEASWAETTRRLYAATYPEAIVEVVPMRPFAGPFTGGVYDFMDAYAATRAAKTTAKPTTHITIERMDQGSYGYEYRVPSPDDREAAAYYTDDKDDAVATARMMWGYQLGESCPEFIVKFRTVEYWTHPDA